MATQYVSKWGSPAMAGIMVTAGTPGQSTVGLKWGLTPQQLSQYAAQGLYDPATNTWRSQAQAGQQMGIPSQYGQATTGVATPMGSPQPSPGMMGPGTTYPQGGYQQGTYPQGSYPSPTYNVNNYPLPPYQSPTMQPGAPYPPFNPSPLTTSPVQTIPSGPPQPIGNDIPRSPAPEATAEQAASVSQGAGVVGLMGARDMTEDLRNRYTTGQLNYPGYVPTQAESPSKVSYMDYTPTAPLSQIQAPDYQLSAPANAPSYQQTAPANAPSYQQTAPAAAPGYNQIAGTPQGYTGLMGGDYERLQQALALPGQLQAQQAYDQAQRDMTNQMGGRGLYGSTMMGSSQANLGRYLGDTQAMNAANAAAQRYQMQFQDLQGQNQFNQAQFGQLLNREQAANQMASTGFGQMLNREQNANQMASTGFGQMLDREGLRNKYGLGQSQLMQDQALSTWKTGMTEADRQQQFLSGRMGWEQNYQDQMRAWKNQGNVEQQNYELARQAYADQVQERIVNQYLALAGKGAPLTAASNNYLTAQQNIAAQRNAAQQASQAATTGAWTGALGTATGAAIGSKDFWSNAGGLMNSGYNYVSGLFNSGSGLDWSTVT